MANLEPHMDFRWVNLDGSQVEAYQITRGARWASENWPAWLQTQKAGKETNRVYTDSSTPNALFIALESGEYEIEMDAYVIHENGILSVQNGEVFEQQFDKVVPIPAKVETPESLPDFEMTHKVEDGKLIPLSPEEIEAKRLALPPKPAPMLSVVPVTESHGSSLRPKAEIAYELLVDGDVDAAKSVLAKALGDETEWCQCAPGQCSGGARWGCRKNSPLVK
jgi:hypothetical protein